MTKVSAKKVWKMVFPQKCMACKKTIGLQTFNNWNRPLQVQTASRKGVDYVKCLFPKETLFLCDDCLRILDWYVDGVSWREFKNTP